VFTLVIFNGERVDGRCGVECRERCVLKPFALFRFVPLMSNGRPRVIECVDASAIESIDRSIE